MPKETVKLWCAGCGKFLFEWDGSTLVYTCQCGASTFSKIDPMKSAGTDEELEELVMPMSFWRYTRGEADEIPHLQHYVGTSNAVNPLKTLLKENLKRIGSISQDDCIICKSRAASPVAR